MYNVSILHYENGMQIRTYKRPILESEDRDVKKKEFKGITENPERAQIVSLNRTKQSIFSIARANSWEWFLTLTFDREKVDSSNYELVVEKGRRFLNNIKKRYCSDLKYLIVPELHADGKHWHLHGLLVNVGDLRIVDSGHKVNGKQIYNLDNWKFGFFTLSRIESQEKVSTYITKYITKEVMCNTKGKRRYWASKNCLMKKDITENVLLTKEELDEFLMRYSDNIEFVKEQDIAPAYQHIRYLEISC